MNHSIMRMVALTCLLIVSLQAQAIEPFVEYRKRVESSQNLSALNDGLFGDSVNLYNGQTTFSNVDISLPGNDALPVQLSRRFSVQILPQNVTTWDTSLGGAGGWDVDVPYIAGTFGPMSGWAADRCTGDFMPSVDVNFQQNEVWQGNTIHIPGQTDRTMLAGGSPTPADGWTHRITTSERDVFVACPPIKSGLTGEGFVMKTTSGTRYYFDQAVTRHAGRMTRTIGSGISATVTRTRVYLLATKVVDRFGNTVQYEYNANGNPTRIWSSDGRVITLAYANGQLASATAAGRTWTYGYTSVEGHPRLSAVVLPDSSRWGFAYSNALRPVDQTWDGNSTARCEEQPPNLDADFTFTVTHPSNAVGTFTFIHKRHYRSGVHVGECIRRTVSGGNTENGTYYYILNTPYFFDVMSLTRKVITGPGISTGVNESPQTWTYGYGGGYRSMFGNTSAPAVYPCGDCAVEKLVTVTEPDGVKKLYHYGFLYTVNEGRVLGVDTWSNGGVLERSETTEYLSDADVAAQEFESTYGAILSGDDPSTARIRPVVRTTIVQDAVTFTTSVDKGAAACGAIGRYCFDRFARPKSETKSSSLGYSKNDKTEYHDDTVRWVLGQVKRTFTNGVETSQTDYDPVSNLPIRVYEFNKLKQTFTYNADGTFATLSDGRDGAGMETTVRLANWKRGTPQTITYPTTPEAPSGSVQSAVINDDGTIASITDEKGSKTCYGYDGGGRINSITYPSETEANSCSEGKWAKTTLSFAPVGQSEYGLPAGHWKRVAITGDARQVTYLDGYFRPVVEEKFDSADKINTRALTVKRYDRGNQLSFESYPVASLSSYGDGVKGIYRTYDALDRVTRVEQDSELGPTRLVTRTEYLDGFKQRVTDPKGHVTTTSFFAMDAPDASKPARIVHPENAMTEILRDDLGRTTQISRSGLGGN